MKKILSFAFFFCLSLLFVSLFFLLINAKNDKNEIKKQVIYLLQKEKKREKKGGKKKIQKRPFFVWSLFRVCLFRVLEVVCVLFSSLLSSLLFSLSLLSLSFFCSFSFSERVGLSSPFDNFLFLSLEESLVFFTWLT